jgi:hypothetical protein
MAGSGVTLYATTAGGNKVVIGSIDWREAIYMPAQINDNVGQIMADIRAMANSIATGWIEFGDGDGVYTATYIAANQFRIDGADVSAYYRAGMRVRAVAPTPGTISGTISAVAYSAPNTLVTVTWDSGAGLSNEVITAILMGIGSGGGAGGQPSYRNILGRNGGCEVWQRGAGGSASIEVAPNTTQYIADGWCVQHGANQRHRAFQNAGLVAGSRYTLYSCRADGDTGTGIMTLFMPLDTDEIAPMQNSIVTLSFTAFKNPNWTASGSQLLVYLFVGTGAPAKRGYSGYTGETQPIAGVPITLSTAVQRFTITSTIVVPSNATQAAVQFNWTPVGTAPSGNSDGYSLDDVQLEVGSVATPFERRPFESELLACRRHFWKTFSYGVAPAVNVGDAENAASIWQIVAAGGSVEGIVRAPVSMRAAPTITTYNYGASNSQMRNSNSSVDCTATAAVGVPDAVRLFATAAAGSTANQRNIIHFAADAGI